MGRKLNEREHIKRMIRLASFSDKASELNQFIKLEMVMMEPEIHGLDINKNKDLWQKFKKVLQHHPLLKKGEEAYEKLNQPNMVARGYWWYDPKSWE